MTEQFPERLRQLRKRRGISQRVLSELCGLSRNMVALYEQGKRLPTIETAAQIADALDVTLDDLCLGKKR